MTRKVQPKFKSSRLMFLFYSSAKIECKKTYEGEDGIEKMWRWCRSQILRVSQEKSWQKSNKLVSSGKKDDTRDEDTSNNFNRDCVWLKHERGKTRTEQRGMKMTRFTREALVRDKNKSRYKTMENILTQELRQRRWSQIMRMSPETTEK